MSFTVEVGGLTFSTTRDHEDLRCGTEEHEIPLGVAEATSVRVNGFDADHLTAWNAVVLGPEGADASGRATDGGLPYAAYVEEEPGVGDSAGLVGFVVDVGGCLTVRELETDLTYVPVFPTTDLRARALSDGDILEVRGGARDTLPDGAEEPEACPADEPFWLVVGEDAA